MAGRRGVVPPVGHDGGQAAQGLSGGQPSSVLGGVAVLGPRTSAIGERALARDLEGVGLGPRITGFGGRTVGLATWNLELGHRLSEPPMR